MDPALQEILHRDDLTEEEVEAIVRLDGSGNPVPGVRIVSRFGETIATCRVRKDRVRESYDDESLISLKAPRTLAPDPEEVVDKNDLSGNASDLRCPEGMTLTGKGVIVAVIDWGIDFASTSFRNVDGTTRFLAIWDQRHPPSSPNRYGYGRIIRSKEINEALRQEDPYAHLKYHPADADRKRTGSHGTHVMDIAAGNGTEGSPKALASEADLIFVHLANRNTKGLYNLGDSVRILEALDFIRSVAGARPWVVNLSVGTHGGPHDGKTLCELAFDALLSEAPNRFLVQSAGNYFHKKIHAEGKLRSGDEHKLPFVVDRQDTTPNELELWYSGKDVFEVKLTSPLGSETRWSKLGEVCEVKENGNVVGRLYHRKNDPNNNDNHVDLFLFKTAPPGKWILSIRATKAELGVFHAWLERDDVRAHTQAVFEDDHAISSSTTGSLANNHLPLIVGAFDAHSEKKEIAYFSSSGPTRDGRTKPDLLAPGVNVLAARSTPRGRTRDQIQKVTRKSGTSMAAPHVTSLVALVLQNRVSPITAKEIRNLICTTACKRMGGLPPERSGAGHLDLACITAMFKKPETKLTEMIMETEEIPADELSEEGKTKNKIIVLVSGGPGLFYEPDIHHDRSWGNYVTGPLKKTETKELQKQFQGNDEVVWFVHRRSHQDRWEDDKKRSEAKEERDRVKRIMKDAALNGKKKGEMETWEDLIVFRAAQRNWKLIWFNTKSELWDGLSKLDKPVSRFYYWGHGRHALWLVLKRRKGEIISPPDELTITADDIRKNKALAKKFAKTSSETRHIFYGCNTHGIAQTWSKVFGVDTQGYIGRIHFGKITLTGDVVKTEGCEEKRFNSKGEPESEEVFTDMLHDEDNTLLDKVDHMISGNLPLSSFHILCMALELKHVSPSAIMQNPDLVDEENTGYEVAAYPGQAYTPKRGDIMIRTVAGEWDLAHVAIIADSEINSPNVLAHENAGPGYFSVVVEGGLIPHCSKHRFARRILSEDGSVPANQIMLRKVPRV